MKKILVNLSLLLLITSCNVSQDNSSYSSNINSSSNSSSVNVEDSSTSSSVFSSNSSFTTSSSSSSSSNPTISTYNLIGKIVDSNNIGLSGIKVSLRNNNLIVCEVETNNEGVFVFEDINKGTYSLTFVISDSRYEILSSHKSVVIDGENKDIVYPTITATKKDISWGELS